MKTIIDTFGDEVSEADFDGYKSPRYKRLLRMAPHCDDPDHPGCENCIDSDCEDSCEDDQDEVDPENPDDPAPYWDNAPTTISDSPARGKEN